MKNNKTFKFLLVFVIIMTAMLSFVGCIPKKEYRLTADSNITVEVGESKAITVAVSDYDGSPTFTYSSSDETVAKVENGYVIGVSEGSATISVSTTIENQNLSATISVTVNPKQKATATFIVDGQEYDSCEYDVGSTIVLPATNPTKASTAQYDYTFDGWEGYEDGAVITENVTFTAKWQSTLREYTVTFKNDGEIYQTTTLNYGEEIVLPEVNPTKHGNAQYSYVFAGWTGYEEGATVSGNEEFTANFTVSTNSYTIKFISNGQTIKEETLLYGATINLPETIPTKQGDAQYSYTFAGWTGYSAAMTVSGNEEFTANFTQSINEYTVKFIANGIVVKEETLAYGSTIVLPETVPTKQGDAQYSYTFAGWSGYEAGMTVDGNEEFTANFTQSVNSYTVKFIANGIVVKEETLAYGTTIILPETEPTKQGNAQYSYAFDKWLGYEEGATVSGDISYEAVFTVSTNSYVIKFIVEGEIVKEETLLYGATINLPEEEPTKDSDLVSSYEFVGWDGYIADMTVSGNHEFTAKFSATNVEYTATFEVDGETYGEVQTVMYNSLISAPEIEPTKEATAQYTYTFDGWYNGNVKWNFETDKLVENVTLVAKFIENVNKYDVVFKNEDGSEFETYEDVEYGSEITLPETNPTKEATAEYTYTFAGWTGYEEGMTVDGNEEFTASFSQSVNEYTVKFIANGIVVKEETLAYGSVINKPDVIPTKPGDVQNSYTFAGWNGYSEGLIVTGNVTFEASFTLSTNGYTVKFVVDGQTVKEDVLAYGEQIVLPYETPVKQGDAQYSYVFDKWIGYENGATVTGNVEYVANFIVSTNSYTIKFIANGQTIKEETLLYGASINLPENPTKQSDAQYSYTFAGWTGYTAGMTVSRNEEFVANFTQSINEYTVKFIANGIVVKEETLAYGSVVVLPENPTKQGDAQYSYTFAGWTGYEAGMTVDGNEEFIANFTQSVNSYTVKFIANGIVVKEETLAYGSTIVLPETEPTKQGNAQYSYAFDKWLGYEEGATVSGDISYEAVFTVSTNSYVIKFIVEGQTIKEETLLYGATINLPSKPTKQGNAQYSYTFNGWSGYEDGMTVDGNEEFTANFIQSINEYTVKFIANGIVVKEETLAYGSEIIAPENPIKPSTASTEYTFDGWMNFVDGATVVGDVEYEAKFTESVRKYNVTVYEDGEEIYSTKAEYLANMLDVISSFEITAPTGYEYSFSYEGELIASDVIVTATKNIKTFTITFVNGSTVVKEETLEFGAQVVAPENPTKAPSTTEEYTFKSWVKELGDESTAVDFSQGVIVDSNIVYYAYFTQSVRKYNVVFIADSVVYESYEAEYGDQVVLPQLNPSKAETSSAVYEFLYWKNYEDGAKVYEDLSYEAVFSETLKTFTVTYIVDGEVYTTEENVEFGHNASKVEDPQKAGEGDLLYVFSHWSLDGVEFELNSPIVKDTQLVAVFNRAYQTRGKVVLPTSVFNENYSVYANAKVVIGEKEYEVENGEFSAVLSAGEHVLTTNCAGFKNISKTLIVSESSIDWGTINVAEHDLTLSGMASNENGIITPGINNSSTNNQALVKSATSSKKFALRYVVNPTSLAYNGSKNKDMFIGFSVGTLDVMINRNNAVRFLISRNYDSVNNKTYSGAKLETLTQPYALTLIVDRTEGFNLSFYVNDAKVFDEDLSTYNWGTFALPTGDLKVGVFYNTSSGNYTSAPVTFTNFDYSFTPSIVSAWENVDLINVTGQVALPEKNIFGENYLNYYDYTDVTVNVNGTNAKVNEDFTFNAEVRPGSINVTVSATDFASVSKNYESATDLAIAQTIELEHNEWIYTTGSNMTASSEMKAENGVISYQTVGSTNYQIAKYAKETNSNKIIITQRANPQEYWKAGTDKQQPIFFIQDATTPKNNLAIIWLGKKLRFLINLDWHNSVTDKTFTENTTVNTQSPTEPFTLTAIFERNATAQTFVVKMYMDDLKVYEGDVSTFVGGTDSGTNKANYKTQTPYANAYIGVGSNWSPCENYEGNPFVTDRVGYSYNSEVIELFEKSKKSYTVTFKAENGSELKSETLKFGSKITPYANQEKASDVQYTYTFAGWKEQDKSDENVIDFATYTVQGETVLVPVFNKTLNSYTVKFVSEGEIVKEETLAYGSIITLPASPTKEGNAQYSYTFDKWDGYENGATVSGNVEYEAVFTPSVNSYTIKFISEGEIVKEETLAYGSDIIAPETIPTKEGNAQYSYTFDKWSGYELGATVSGNAEFVAEFSSTLNEYTIIFYNEDGQTEFERRENVPYGTVITAPESVPTKESDLSSDYEFARWDGFEKDMTVSGNHSFVAVFSATNLEYEVIFKNGEEIIKQETLAYGTVITAPETIPSKAQDDQYTYSFKGWKNFVAGETTVTGALTFEAEFNATLRQYSVKIGENEANLYDYGSHIENPGDATKESTVDTTYTFDGWYNGDVKWNFETDTVKGDVTLVAKFTESARKYTVSYIVDGEEIDSEDIEYNGVATKSASVTKESTVDTAYTFDGWYNGDVKWNFANDTVKGNVTLVARFSESVRKYTVSYIVDGIVVDEEEVEYNANATLASVSKEDEGVQVYTFSHWSTTEGGEAFDGKVLKDETLYAVFEVAYRTSGKLGFASGFADNYSLYNIDDSVVTIADNSVSLGSDGNFEQILSAGTYTLTATHSKFESVSTTLTVSDTEYEWGEIKFENHLMTLDRITYENGVLTPKTGSGTTYQTALFSNDITSNIFAIRQKVNPVSDLYMTNSEQIGFRIDGGNNKKVNLLITDSKLRVMFNNTFDNYSEVRFVDTNAGIKSKTEPYYLSAVVQRSASTFVVSIFVDDTLMLSVDLAGVNVNYATTGVSYSYSDYIPFSETVKVGAMINYSNNKYTSVPLTLSDADYSVDANAIESYFNGKVGIAGRISLPSDLLGEDYVDEYGSAVSVKVNGVNATLNTANGLFTAVVDKNSTVTISASASGAFVASEKTKTVQDVTISTGNIGVIALEGYIGKTGFTLSASNTIDENGHILPKEATYQRALIKPNAKATTFVVKHTVNPNELYVAQQGGSSPNPQHGVAITDGTNILAMVIENKNMRFISTSNNNSQNVSGASSNPSLTTLTSAYTLTYFITVTNVDGVTTYALDVYLTYTVSGSEKTIKLFDKSNCKVDTTNTASVVIPTGTITGVGACWHYSIGRYTAGAGFTVSDVHISDDAKVVSAEQTALNSLVSIL